MAAEEDKVGQLEAEALKRKERLAALKRKQTADNSNNTNNQTTLPKPLFRSYTPLDEKLKDEVVPPPNLPELDEQVQEELKQAKTPATVAELDLENLAPRKPDWDLKRDIAKKLDKLERRTQKAIAELIRDRLRDNKQDLASAVNAASMQP
nr:EOG090X0KZ2 [Eulimnadia texana]